MKLYLLLSSTWQAFELADDHGEPPCGLVDALVCDGALACGGGSAYANDGSYDKQVYDEPSEQSCHGLDDLHDERCCACSAGDRRHGAKARDEAVAYDVLIAHDVVQHVMASSLAVMIDAVLPDATSSPAHDAEKGDQRRDGSSAGDFAAYEALHIAEVLGGGCH